jgi:hypothetical protein
MSDRGPDPVKEKIQATLDKILGNGSSSELAPAPTDGRRCLKVASLGSPAMTKSEGRNFCSALLVLS